MYNYVAKETEAVRETSLWPWCVIQQCLKKDKYWSSSDPLSPHIVMNGDLLIPIFLQSQ